MFLVYRIHDLETAEGYIGSTNNFKVRLQDHKKLDCSSKQILERNIYEVEILEENIEEDVRRVREQYYIDKYNGVNERRAYTSKEERNRQKKENAKNHYIKTKYDEMECICGSTFRRKEKARHEKRDKHKRYLQNNNLS